MYSSLTDLEKRLEPETLAALADDDKDGAADTDVVNAAIDDADSEIDSYLRVRYTLPLSSTPDVIKSLSCAIAIYNLFLRRRETVSEEHQKRYEWAVSLLEKIAEGKIDIGGAPDVFEHDVPKTTSDPEERIFERNKMNNF